jgi:NAD(P)-dependent dehydrogenase (short-subunit alcohol dehydrogenase family)
MIKLANPLRIHYCYFHCLSLNDDRLAIEKGAASGIGLGIVQFSIKEGANICFQSNIYTCQAAADAANAAVSKNNAILIECPIDIANAAIHLVISCCI